MNTTQRALERPRKVAAKITFSDGQERQEHLDYYGPIGLVLSDLEARHLSKVKRLQFI